VLEKASFRCEAILKNSIIKNGVVQDDCIYAILKDEFETKP
jgi:RimJ/RimL family protein N-acetyltransferase